MDNLVIKPTKKTPGVEFTGGNLLFYGRSIIDESLNFYDPVFDWIRKYIEKPCDKTDVAIKLEYIDANSVKLIFELLKILKAVVEKGVSYHIKWYYEYGDLEMLQLGVILQGRLSMEFEFNEFEPTNSRM